MTSIIIPLGSGSRNNDLELRYCLRSIEKYLSGYGDIFIIGERPDWLQNVIHIPLDEGFAPQSYEKERNIFNKIMAVCKDERVTDDFLFMNDDHYLLKEYEAGKFPYYYHGRLSEKRTVTDYKKTVKNTSEFIGDVAYFDIHCPILYNKRKFGWLSFPDWNKHFGYCIKTLYLAYNSLSQFNTEEYADLKISEPLTSSQIREQLTGRAWFSIGDKAFNGEIVDVLQDLYPLKSKYER